MKPASQTLQKDPPGSLRINIVEDHTPTAVILHLQRRNFCLHGVQEMMLSMIFSRQLTRLKRTNGSHEGWKQVVEGHDPHKRCSSFNIVGFQKRSQDPHKRCSSFNIVGFQKRSQKLLLLLRIQHWLCQRQLAFLLPVLY